MSTPSSKKRPAMWKRPASNRPTTRPAIQIRARTTATATAGTDTVTVATAAGIAVIAEVIDAEAATETTAVEKTAAHVRAEVTQMTDTDAAARAIDTVVDEGTEAATTTVVEDALVRAPHAVTGHVASGKDPVNAVLVRSAKEAAVRRPLPQKLLKTIVTSVLSSFSRSPSVPKHAIFAPSSRLLDLLLKHRLLRTE